MVAFGSAEEIEEMYEQREFGKALREVMRIADVANERFDKYRPWELAKDPEQKPLLAGRLQRRHPLLPDADHYLAPVLPATAERVARELFGMDRPFNWSDLLAPVDRIAPYKHLMARVEAKQIDALFEPPAEEPAPMPLPGGKAIADTISIDDFSKVDLRIAKITDAALVDGSDKLLKTNARCRRWRKSNRIRRHQVRLQARGPGR